ncbi:hypothetical protein GCM10023066_12680 [Nocardioides kongjuensis]
MSGQVFWAYVEDGGSLDLTVAFRNRVDGGSATTATIRAVSPSGLTFDHTVSIAPNDPMPALHIVGLTDAQAGVWQVAFDDGVPSGDHDAGIATWGITPRTAGGVAHKGRVFTEEYTQTVQATRPVDPSDTWDRTWSETLYFLNRHGVTYQGVLRRYNPIQGAIAASPRGVLAADGSSRHASASFHDATASVDSTRYRIFFEPPDVAMPDEATFAARGTQWLGPNYRDPLISDIVHTPTATTGDGAWAGTVAWNLNGASGPVRVRIDTDGDGSFDTTLDPPEGASQVVWDGRSSTGAPLPASADVTVRVVMTEAAEIHFTLSDVERLAGGLEVTALSGPEAGSKRLSWNDNPLGTDCETNVAGVSVPCADVPSPRAATNADSSGGVHAWKQGGSGPGSGGWGDARNIDSWTTTSVNVAATAGLPGTRFRAVDDAVTTTSLKPVTVDVLANDTGVRASTGATVTLPSIALPPDEPGVEPTTVAGCASGDGVWKVNPDQTVTFTPTESFHGSAVCRYAVSNADGQSRQAVIEVTVDNVLRLADDQTSTTSNKPVAVDVLGNDRAVDEGARLARLEYDARQGTWEIQSDRTILFVPNPRFHGVATAVYTVVESDGTTATATITAHVSNVAIPVADHARTEPGEPVTIQVLRNDRTVGRGATVTVTGANPKQGQWQVNPDRTVTFTPAPGFHGTANATYTVTEADGATGTTTITVKVPDRSASVTAPGDRRGALPALGGPAPLAALVGLLAMAIGALLIAGSRRRRPAGGRHAFTTSPITSTRDGRRRR